jgi:uncharacterized membrane protein YccC
MWCRKFLSFAVLTVVVSSQAANADINSDTAVATTRGDVSAIRASLPSGTEASYEFLLRDGGLRSLAAHKYEPHTPQDMDTWLMLLVAGGLVVMQLRRKQKTLPQRPVIESENKLFWG